MSAFKTTKFKQLQKEWYDKLEAEGFRDIELHQEEHESFNDLEAKQVYYGRASAYLFRGNFPTMLEKTVWFLHSEGLSFREMVKIVKASRERVSAIVARHINLMGTNNE